MDVTQSLGQFDYNQFIAEYVIIEEKVGKWLVQDVVLHSQ